MAGDIFSLFESGNPFTSLMFLGIIHGIPNHTHTCHSLQVTLGISQSIRRITQEPIVISGIEIWVKVVWEIFMTNNHVVFSWVDRSRTLFSNMFYVLWLISHILSPVKRDHLTDYILVLVYCPSYDNNRLGTFRIVFFYASRFYYRNHVFVM